MFEGERRRNEGMRKAASHVEDAPWAAVADEEMARLARSGDPFTAEDLIGIVGKPSTDNAIGAMFGKWSKRGAIVSTGMTKTTHALGHARRILVWKGTGKAWKPREQSAKAVRRELPPARPLGVEIGPARPCPSCHSDHPVGTTCANGWAPWR
jgi:hypothetical protein